MKDNCTLTKVYSFSAAHRLHNEKFSDEENREIFGKCNNPNGHGHDYSLELTIGGEVDEKTGMIIDIVKLDGIINSVLDELDHKRLDIEIEYFTKVRASGENIAEYLWDKIVVLIHFLVLHSIRYIFIILLNIGLKNWSYSTIVSWIFNKRNLMLNLRILGF